MVGIFVYNTEIGQTLQIGAFCFIILCFVLGRLLWTIYQHTMEHAGLYFQASQGIRVQAHFERETLIQ